MPPPLHLLVRLLVPQPLCGVIIGKHGCTIRNYAANTNTVIRWACFSPYCAAIKDHLGCHFLFSVDPSPSLLPPHRVTSSEVAQAPISHRIVTIAGEQEGVLKASLLDCGKGVLTFYLCCCAACCQLHAHVQFATASCAGRCAHGAEAER